MPYCNGKFKAGNEEAIIDETVERINFPIEMSFAVINNSMFTQLTNQLPRSILTRYHSAHRKEMEEGDRFYPLGMKGSRKLSDFLIDSKIPLPDKENIFVLEAPVRLHGWLDTASMTDSG
jgi:tRNA(Ile)-lysidine synthetase-like protein